VSREKLSPQQWGRLEAELRKGPLAQGFAGDQRWTLGGIKTLIGKLFHVGYTPEGVWKLMLVRIIKRKLKKIQYRLYLITGCLAATGLTIEPW
jgi:transposase